MGPEYACACCGSKVLSVCEKCGTVLCGGGTTKGGGCACPGCGTELTLTGEAATAARGSASGKKKGLW
jgi:phage FluMu protein Com